MYEDWIAKEDAAQRTGLSTKTLERMALKGIIRREYRNVPGRKPLPVFDPLGIEQLASKTLTPIPVKKTTSRQVKTVAKTSTILSDPVAVVMSLSFKQYLTEREAALFLGLSPTYMEMARKSHIIESLKIPGVRGWRYDRDTLRQHRVSLFIEQHHVAA